MLIACLVLLLVAAAGFATVALAKKAAVTELGRCLLLAGVLLFVYAFVFLGPLARLVR